jgi:hypothetical protein
MVPIRALRCDRNFIISKVAKTMNLSKLKELLLTKQREKTVISIYNIKSQPVPYSPNEIYKAWSVPPDSGVFSEVGATRLPFQVSWIVEKHQKCDYDGINFASALLDSLRSMEQSAKAGRLYKIISLFNYCGRILFAKASRFLIRLKRPSEKQVDILVVIEYCNNKHDLLHFDMLEKANPGLCLDYWSTTPSVRDQILKYNAHLPGATISKLLANKQSIQDLSPWRKPMRFSADLYNTKTNPLKNLNPLFARIVWNYYSSLAKTISDAFFLLFAIRKPRMILIMDDTKLFGNIAAKVARKMKIPSILIPHAGGGGPAYFPATCDYVTVWGRKLMSAMKGCGISERRLWIIGDMVADGIKNLSDKDESIRKKFGNTGKTIIGYFASSTEPDEAGLQALISLHKRLHNCLILVRPHPRYQYYYTYLKKKYFGAPVTIIPETELTLEQFCSVTDIVMSFDSSALYYGFRYGNLGIQGQLFKGREAEYDYKELLDLPIAKTSEELYELVVKMSNQETRQEFIERRLRALPKMWEAFGTESAALFYSKVKGLIKSETLSNA